MLVEAVVVEHAAEDGTHPVEREACSRPFPSSVLGGGWKETGDPERQVNDDEEDSHRQAGKVCACQMPEPGSTKILLKSWKDR